MIQEKYTATGRRKTAVARINMSNGTGKISVNGKAFDEYFPTVNQQNHLLQPLQVVKQLHAFDVQIKAEGGGLSGQAGAARLGIARALLKVDPELRPSLKAEGLLTRDPRKRERLKPGQPGARKRFQFSKR
jgi:small subunit ribosomal protein S9